MHKECRHRLSCDSRNFHIKRSRYSTLALCSSWHPVPSNVRITCLHPTTKRYLSEPKHAAIKRVPGPWSISRETHGTPLCGLVLKGRSPKNRKDWISLGICSMSPGLWENSSHPDFVGKSREVPHPESPTTKNLTLCHVRCATEPLEAKPLPRGAAVEEESAPPESGRK